MLVRLQAGLEGFRDSLFFFPALFVAAAIVLAQVMLEVDARLSLASVPSYMRFTVDSARELLATVAGATVTVTGVVFALTALSVQLASSQFSPRVVRGFLRDGAIQAGIGFMAGTFTYSLVVLRAVRSTDGGEPTDVVPNLSTALALVLAIGVVIAILAYVDHTAQSLQATQLIGRVTRGTVALVRRRFPEAGTSEAPAAVRTEVGDGLGQRLAAPRSGWVQQIDEAELLRGLPPGGVVRVDVRVGSFVHQQKRLATVWAVDPKPGQPEKRLVEGFAIGRIRTMQQDVEFGIRQLVDIALRALSPGVNDATTAYECMVHLGEVLYEILRRDLPPAAVAGDDGRRLMRPHELTQAEYVHQAIDQVRANCADMPDLCVGLLHVLTDVARELEDLGLADRVEPLRLQGRLVRAGAEASSALPHDLARVREAAAALCPAPTGPAPPGPRD